MSSASSKTTVSVPGPIPAYSSILAPRLEDHYYTTLMEDVMILTYDHNSPKASLQYLQSQPEWSRSMPANMLQELYSTPLERLATRPFDDDPTTNLISLETSTLGQKTKSRKLRKRLYNPIDYTIVRKDEWKKENHPPEIREPFSPLISRIPALQKVTLKIWSEDAVKNKYVLFWRD